MARYAVAVLVLLALTAGAASAEPAPVPITIRDQTDGVNSLRVFTVAAFCRGPAPCTGTAKLTRAGKTLGKAPFTAAGKTTFKTPMKLSASVFKTLHKASHKRMKALLTMTLADGTAVSHAVTLRL